MKRNKTIILMFAIGIPVVIGLMMVCFWALGNVLEAGADVQKCQRLTGMGFLECGQLTREEIDALPDNK